jgi:hypothetical protein
MSAKTVNEYIGSLPEDKAEIISQIRQIILDTAPQARESIKWAQPVYEYKGPFCYMKAFSKSVNFGFWRGVDIKDPEGLLEGSGDKMQHIKISSQKDINEKEFRSFIRQAIRLNETKGDPTKNK